MEQSRSPRCTKLPCVSAKTCTSTWRGAGRNRSNSRRYRRSALSASAPRAGKRLGDLRLFLHDAHALATAAGRRLDDQGQTQLQRRALRDARGPAVSRRIQGARERQRRACAPSPRSSSPSRRSPRAEDRRIPAQRPRTPARTRISRKENRSRDEWPPRRWREPPPGCARC